jgi:hypothetical protein
METEKETKAEVIEEVKTVKMVVLAPEQWEIIVKYLYEVTVPFGSGKRAGQVEDAVASAKQADLTLTDNEQK